VLAATVAACSATSSAAKGGTAPVPVNATNPPSTARPSPTAPARQAAGNRGAVDLVVTDAVRAQLVRAGAALHQLPASDYVGLEPSRTYYARDVATGDEWAAAGLQPAPNSYDAGVANQDEGSYMVFTRPPGGAWHGWETGLTGGPRGPCPVTVPPSVLAVWGWPPGSCYPLSGAPAAVPSPPEATAPCTPAHVAAHLVGTPLPQGQYEMVLELVNNGSTPCTMTGFPGFELVGPMSDGATTYDPARQEVSYAAVTVAAGGTGHADFWALPGPGSCDAGQAWVPTGVNVTLPGGTAAVPVAWPGGSVDNCQGGATHPGTYVGPVEAGT
jgi:hypothetical protein